MNRHTKRFYNFCSLARLKIFNDYATRRFILLIHLTEYSLNINIFQTRRPLNGNLHQAC